MKLPDAPVSVSSMSAQTTPIPAWTTSLTLPLARMLHQYLACPDTPTRCRCLRRRTGQGAGRETVSQEVVGMGRQTELRSVRTVRQEADPDTARPLAGA